MLQMFLDDYKPHQTLPSVAQWSGKRLSVAWQRQIRVSQDGPARRSTYYGSWKRRKRERSWDLKKEPCLIGKFFLHILEEITWLAIPERDRWSWQMEHSQGEENSRRRRWLVASAAAATTTQPKNREVVVVGALVNVNSSRTMDSELSSQFVGIGLHLWSLDVLVNCKCIC